VHSTSVRRRGWSRLAAVSLTSVSLTALLVGCSSSKKTPFASAKPGSSQPAAAAASTATTVKATGGGTFCQQVAKSINTDAAAMSSSADLPSLKSQIEGVQALESAALKSAPATIKADLVVLFDASNKFDDALAKAGYDYSKLDPTALTGFSTPAVETATQHVTNYLTTVCGINTSAGAPSAASS
jgi:hypothetical protein